MKRIVKVLAAFLTLALMFPVFTSGSETALLNIVDDSAKYKLYTGTCGGVYDADDPSAQKTLFSYDVPQGGAVVLIFFNAAGDCHNSNELISGLSSTLWAHDPRFEIIAVDSLSHGRDRVKSYLHTYDLEGCVDRAYYNPKGAYLQAWYAEFIKRGGNMEGVNGFSATLEFAHAIIITEVNGKPTIRYSVPNIGSITLLTSLIGSLFGIPEGQNRTDEVEIPGVRKYDYVEDVLALTNEVRASYGKAPLKLSARLTELAMERAEECALFYSHERPNGYSCFSIGNGTGRYPGGVLLSENIAIGRETPGLVMEGWTNSEGHLANMTSGDVTTVGIGCFVNNGHHFWVQIFADGTDSSTYYPKGATEVTAVVETLESRLTVRPSGRKIVLSMEESQDGEELFGYTENLTEYQQHISYLCRIIPKEAFAYDSSGDPVARLDSDGKIYPLKEGVGTLEVRLCDIDDGPETVTVRVRRAPRDAGDVDGDGAITMKDVLLLRKVVAGSEKLTPEFERYADVDGDGSVNMKDILLLRKILAGAA